MTKTLDLTKTVHDLAEQYPEVVTIMADLGFKDIAKPMALNSVGRVMTIPRGAAIKGIGLDDVVRAFEEHGFAVVGADAEEATTDGAAATQDAEPAGDEVETQPGASAEPEASHEAADEAGRARLLESYVARLSAGEPLEDVRRDFVANFRDVDAAEIARAEQNLIEGGARISDVQRLCDVHSALFHGATREEKIRNAEQDVAGSLTKGTGADDFKTRVLAALKGHPVNVLTLENDAIADQISRCREALASGADTLAGELARLQQVGVHYAKKGDLIYPVLKVNHGFSGPADVMWGVDDEIRAELRSLVGATEHDDAWTERVKAVLTRADEMIYKEANILLPLCVQNFTEEEWLRTYLDMKGYDLCLIDEAPVWRQGEEYAAKALADATESTARTSAQEVVLPSGHLTPAQLDAILNTIPLEISFVDEEDVNRYWNDSGQKKLFKRPSSALDRKVWNCHPPKVEAMVRRVISMLRSGERDSVDVWMQKEGQPVLVRYMAVRDRGGAYLGTLEVVQPMGFARDHFAGEQAPLAHGAE